MIRLSESYARVGLPPPPKRGMSTLTFALIAGASAVVCALVLALVWPF